MKDWMMEVLNLTATSKLKNDEKLLKKLKTRKMRFQLLMLKVGAIKMPKKILKKPKKTTKIITLI